MAAHSETGMLSLIAQAEAGPPQRRAAEDLDGRHLTLGDLRQRSNRVANGLLGSGLPAGSAVAYVGGNRIEYPEIEFGIAKAGMVRVPLPPGLPVPDLVYALELARVRAVLVDAAEATDELRAALPDEVGPRLTVGAAPGWTAYETWLGAARTSPPAMPVSGSAPYQIRFTSGSSGRPKGVVISHLAARTAVLGNTYVLHREAFEERPRTLHQGPVTLTSGWLVLPTLISGGVNVFAGQFSSSRFSTRLVEHGITWTVVVPTMLRMAVGADPRLDSLRGSALSCLAYGGEPPPVEALSTLAPHTDALVQVFGQTEAPSWTLVVSRAEHRDERLWSSAGRPIPGFEVAVEIDGEPFRRATGVGPMLVRGTNLASGLLGAPDEFTARLRPDGWWETGDLATIDEQGRVHVVGRGSELIVRGGRNVHPAEIERILIGHPDAVEVVVVGTPDPVWGEVPVAVVHAERPVDAAVLDRWCRAALPDYKVPARYVVVAERLPRVKAGGKVARGAVRALVAAEGSDHAG